MPKEADSLFLEKAREKGLSDETRAEALLSAEEVADTAPGTSDIRCTSIPALAANRAYSRRGSHPRAAVPPRCFHADHDLARAG